MPGKAIAAHAQALTAFPASGSRAAGVLSSSGAGAGGWGSGGPDGEVGGKSIQVRVGPGRKHLADPQVKLVLLHRPWMKAALSSSITRSRSACDART